jgi:hypothetical protein
VLLYAREYETESLDTVKNINYIHPIKAKQLSKIQISCPEVDNKRVCILNIYSAYFLSLFYDAS